MEVSYLFAGIGMIILIGFLGTLLFERTKIPDILILVFIGLLIGPILSTYTNFGLLDDPQVGETLKTIAPHFAALALVIILFDGGLNLNLEKTMRKMGLSIIHSGICFVGLMVTTALVCYYVLNMDIWIGLLLGAALGGGPSGPVVIPLVLKSSAKEDTKTLLTLESVLTDVLCIVTVMILITIISEGGVTSNPGAVIQTLLSSFILAAFIAFVFGVFWLMVLKKLEGKPFSFMITIAALFSLYAICEFIGVNGAIAALVFGLVLSNKDEIARILKFKGSFVVDEHITQFHSEVSFLVRTFFFVYLGLTFTFALNSDAFGSVAEFIPQWISWHPLLMLGFVFALIFGGMLLVRAIATEVTCKIHPDSKEDKPYIFALMGRGLAAGVVATLPFTIPLFQNNPDYYARMANYENLFLNVAFMTIILSVTVTSIGMAVMEHRRAKAGYVAPDQETGGDWAIKSPTYRKAMQKKVETPAEKQKTAAKEGPKPWSGSPARTEPSRPVREAAPQQGPAPQPKPTTVQAQPVKHTQGGRAEHKPAPHGKNQMRKDHPLVKRAAESERELPKNPAAEQKKVKK